jgi:hypothetical protein
MYSLSCVGSHNTSPGGSLTRSTPRPRHEVSPRTVRVLSPFFRQSHGRGGVYVLRGVGHRWGPVLQPRGTAAEQSASGDNLPTV